MESSTQVLRRLLDERGIEHMDFNMPERSLTLFAGDEHDGAYVENSVDTILTVYGASPEQAIDATLGRGTCFNDSAYPDGFFCCSECGQSHIRNIAYLDLPRYCPNCGRKVVE